MKRFLALSIFSITTIVILAKIDTVYIIPFSHLDIGFTGTQEEVGHFYRDMYEELNEFMESFPDFKFTVETFWQFEQWLKEMTDGELLEDYLRLAREGRLEFCAAYGSMHTGFTNGYVLEKSLDRALLFAAENDLEIGTCLMNDVPGFCADLPDILEEKGIDYFMSGLNDHYGFALDLQGTAHLFYWEGPSGGRALSWVSKASYAEGYLLKNRGLLLNHIESLEREGYPYSELAIMVAFDNAGYLPGAVAFLDLYETWPADSQVTLKMATPTEFMRLMESKYAGGLPVYRGDWSGWWEIVKSGGPYSAGVVLKVQRYAASLAPELAMIDRELFDEMNRNLIMYGEHTAAVTAGWPGKLSLAGNKVSNRTVVEYAETSKLRFDELAKKLAEEALCTVSAISSYDGITRLEIPFEGFHEKTRLPVKIDGGLYYAYPFRRDYPDSWDSCREGFLMEAPLNRGLNCLEIGEVEGFEVDKDEDRSFKVLVDSTGKINILYNGAPLIEDVHIASYFTGRPEVLERVDGRLLSVERNVSPIGETLTLEVDHSPVCEIDIVTFNSGGVRLSLVIDKGLLPTVPYRDHSINLVLSMKLSLPGELTYMGARSMQVFPGEFPARRPPFLAFNGLVTAERTDSRLFLASRQSFMFNWENPIIRFQLMRHYSFSATADRGIVLLDDTEPGSPGFIVFSFYIDFMSVTDCGEEISSASVSSFLNPPLFKER